MYSCHVSEAGSVGGAGHLRGRQKNPFFCLLKSTLVTMLKFWETEKPGRQQGFYLLKSTPWMILSQCSNFEIIRKISILAVNFSYCLKTLGLPGFPDISFRIWWCRKLWCITCRKNKIGLFRSLGSDGRGGFCQEKPLSLSFLLVLSGLSPPAAPTSDLPGNNFALPMNRLNFLKGFFFNWLAGWSGLGLGLKFVGWKNIKDIKM